MLFSGFAAPPGVTSANASPIGSLFCLEIAIEVDLSLKNETLMRHTFIRHFRDLPLRHRHTQSQKISRQQRLNISQSPSLNHIQHRRKYLTQFVIILSRTKRAASSPPVVTPSSLRSQPQISDGTVDKTFHTADRDYTHKPRKMGSKASKLSPKNGKLQSSQEKKDKEEMKEPTNYYTHRSKSMRRKAGKEGAHGGAGGVSMGSGGAGGAI
ncbi:hypothetical protein N0V91_007680 [Didymella pomorum]|uniref:Uncharacterized protein n=1 Tax=Didymella pomorum TaxID=749634 RepID=A0A9W8ZAZ1_9PLEO|nr:hypothetical protein N0V91_007680 [Didymella pomorum]